MNVKIRTLRYRGDLSKERLVLQVLTDTDIGSYAVFVVDVFEGNTVSNTVRDAYWFPDKKVKKGDLVVLYSKDGLDKEKQNSDGSTTHFFYWEQYESKWSRRGSAAVVLEIQGWISKVFIDDDSTEDE
jgi:hypothetical protein